ncbi:hypothetical protein Ahy_B07g086367 [Arachis hypogaea]|uniref:Uncharacterized protein n=1 Tax=Arachis hypogaea TaxID=3818 RepID=A0A444Y9H3_ARAHY|nr:hypothetical protein Ahy_B07g086367 [Arachis hypogaea]
MHTQSKRKGRTERERKEKKGGSWNHRTIEGGDVEREEELREEGAPLCLHRCRQFAFCCRRGKSPPSSSSSRASRCQLPPPSHLPSRTTLRMHRRDRRMERGRRRKKEEALFALMRPVAVRGVTIVAASRGCVTEPLSPENSAASPGFTADKGIINKDELWLVRDWPLLFLLLCFLLHLLDSRKGAIPLENSKNTYKVKSELQYNVKSYCMEYYFETKTGANFNYLFRLQMFG